MPENPFINNARIARMVKMRHEGFTQSEIGAQFGISQGQVSLETKGRVDDRQVERGRALRTLIDALRILFRDP